MSTNLIRMRNAAIAVKAESTAGTDSISGSPASGDWVQGDVVVNLNPMVGAVPGFTGSLDSEADTVGGFKPTVTITVPFRGSGTAGTPPALGTLLKACAMALTQTASAVGSPTAAASGTTTTVTAASPFGTTADAYNGMPLLVTGDQTFTTGVVDYTGARVITLGETRTALTSSSLLQIPINDLYKPSSDETAFINVSMYCYYDGTLYKFVGGQGTWSLTLTAGEFGVFTFTMMAQLLEAPSNTSLPSGAATALTGQPAPPRWVNGKSQLNKKTARCNTLRVDFGVQQVLPDNPEATYGFDPAAPIGRKIVGNINPYMDTNTNTALFTALAANTDVPLMAILGSTAGNRMMVMLPTARLMDLSPGNRGGLGEFGIPFVANGPDVGCYVCFF